MSSKNIDTRKKILEAASKLLLESNGKGVRMSDIARATGVSRQAVYLHFESRSELMIAAVRYLDDVHGLAERVRRFNETRSGVEKLNEFVEFWGHHVRAIYGVAKALMALRETDDAAAAAWDDRMNSVRAGCRETIDALKRDGALSRDWTEEEAADLLWAMLSIPTWERLTIECGWSDQKYVKRMQEILKRILQK